MIGKESNFVVSPLDSQGRHFKVELKDVHVSMKDQQNKEVLLNIKVEISWKFRFLIVIGIEGRI